MITSPMPCADFMRRDLARMSSGVILGRSSIMITPSVSLPHALVILAQSLSASLPHCSFAFPLNCFQFPSMRSQFITMRSNRFDGVLYPQRSCQAN